MAEYNISNLAGSLVVDYNTVHPWICQDDSGNFWTIFQDTDGNIRIYKSIDSGSTWILMDTLDNDFFTDNPFPVNSFCIVNCKGINKVYILMHKRSTAKAYGVVINTLTDVISLDLDGVSIQINSTKVEARWDKNSNKLYLGMGRNDYYSFYIYEIKLDGTLGTVSIQDFYGNQRAYCFDIDATGNKYFVAIKTEGGIYGCNFWKNTVSFLYDSNNYSPMHNFCNIVVDYNNKLIFGYVRGTVLYLYRMNSAFNDKEINGVNYDLGVGHTPTSCWVTVDGIGNIYFIYTDGSDNEAYYIKYDTDWGTPVKISSDNDGELVCPELKSLYTVTDLLLTYQSTV